MQRNRRTLAAALPVLAGLALAATAATSPFPENERVIELKSGRAWADANRDHLPKTLDAISMLPIGHRKAVLAHSNVTIAQRERLWREHIESFVLPTESLTAVQRKVREGLGVTLTADQVAFIRETLDSLHTGIGEPADSASRKAFSGAVCKKAIGLFPRIAAARLFAHIGPVYPRPAPIHEASIIGELTDRIRDLTVRLGVRKPPSDPCVCNVNSLCDCTASENSACVYDQPAGICQVRGDGCGCFWVFECNGSQCYDPER